MNHYTVEFEYTSQMVEAGDSDLAIWKAEKETGLSAEDRGELLSLTLHGETDKKFLSCKGIELDAINNRPLSKPAAPKLPSRRQGGLTLSYQSGDLMVISFGYSASLTCAYHEGELCHDKGRHDSKTLSDKQHRIVSTWLDNEAAYYEQNGWATWGEING